jgi:sugar phosphate isomerase/epimerase
VTAWALSGFGDEIDADPRVQLAVLAALGCLHIEVRSAWGTNITELGDEELERLAALLRTGEMAVSAIASPVGKSDVEADDEHRFERALHAADVLGARYIRVFTYQHEGRPAGSVRDAVLCKMSELAERARRAGVVLVAENEVGVYGDRPERLADVVESVDSPALRVAWDGGNFVRVGLRPFDEAYPLLAAHIAYLQVKDAVFGGGSVPAGAGDAQLPQTVRALRDAGYDGFASLEPHLTSSGRLGGFSGPERFGGAARAFAALATEHGVELT